MKVFGYSSFDDIERVPVPVGEICPYCEEPIAEGDCGEVIPHLGSAKMAFAPVVERAWHLECAMRMSFGSVAHQQKRCSCYGGTEPEEDATLTKRQQAREAAIFGLRSRNT